MTDERAAKRPKVLIIDDSRMVRASLIKNLRDQFEVREESDGESGWGALVIDPGIDVVVTDLDMPHLDGFGLLIRIRDARVSRISSIPVIIISGDEDDEAREKARKLGADDFVAKGASAAELVSRLDNVLQLSRTRAELSLTRAAQSEPAHEERSGIATRAGFDWHGEKALSLARRHQSAMGVLVVEIDHFEQLQEWHGAHVAQLISRKLAKILAAKVRKEDTVAQLAPEQFAVLSPNTDIVGSCAFALRMQKAIDKLVMTYREDRIRITISAGVANSRNDGTESVSSLIGVAVTRVRQAIEGGGNRVMADEGEVGEAFVERYFEQSVSLDHVLFRLRAGAEDEITPQLPRVVRSAMPLLEFLDRHCELGLPMARLMQWMDQDDPDGAHDDLTRTRI